MAKTADQYPKGLQYGDMVTLPDGRAYLHRGVDYECPVGTDIPINGMVIGKTGDTGYTFGAHLHIQAGNDKYAQDDIDPTNYEYKGEIVVEKGEADQWGKYVIVAYKGKYIVYAHLSKILVTAGTKLDGDSMYKEKWEAEKKAHANTKNTLTEARRKMNIALTDAKKWKAAFTDAKKKLDKVRGERNIVLRWVSKAKDALNGK